MRRLMITTSMPSHVMIILEVLFFGGYSLLQRKIKLGSILPVTQNMLSLFSALSYTYTLHSHPIFRVVSVVSVLRKCDTIDL